MKEYTLNRTGNAPLTFTGELIGIGGTRPASVTSTKLRWHELTLYKSRGGQLVAHIKFRTEQPTESAFDTVELAGDADSLREALDHYEPVDFLDGYPEGDKWASRQERLLTRISDQYLAAVSELLTNAGIVDTIE